MAGELTVLVWILGILCWIQGEEVNIAFLKNASTSLGYRLNFKPDLAVDGNTVTAEFTGRCFQGAGSPADWTVDLGQVYQLHRIRVYIRAVVLSRTANSIIYLDNNSSRVCYTFPSIISDNPTDVMCNETARYVTIRNPEHSLNICEVEIYVCSKGTYGTKCTTSCGHCASPTCDRWTGFCRGDCVAGYRGNKCDTVCDNATYGVNCREKCADRKCHTNNASCNSVTGSCDTGCRPGWKGSVCVEECGNQHYGSNCSSLCTDRNCIGNSTCHHVTGSCDKGCLAGWEGTDCVKMCDNATYGVNCREKCADRKCHTSNASCNSVTGSCDTGCLPGWMGSVCVEECGNQHYGSNCSSLCTDRNCNGNSTCHHVTGSCDKGCLAGWRGTDCMEECDNEHYGPGCTGVCSSRHCNGNSSCNQTTGQCDGGCQIGWAEIDCTYNNTSLLKATYDSTGASSPVPGIVGGVIGAVVLVLVLVLVIVLIRRGGKSICQRGSSMSKKSHESKANTGTGPSFYENVAFHEDRRKASAAPSGTIELVQLNGQTGSASGDCDSRSVVTLEEEENYDSPVQLEEGPGAPEMNYYNLDNINKGHLISLSQLEVCVTEFEKKPELSEEEFKQLPDTFLHPYDESQKPANKTKNRFKGYYPYNYNRVVLHDDGDGGKSDYINASYLDGYNAQKRYIAAQGPYKDNIIDDFWRMIWQEGCSVVVMLTGLFEGGKMKCLRYWPEKGSSTFGDVTVTMETVTRLADYSIRKLAVQHRKDSTKRHVTHFHFTSWPDHGVPDTSGLLQYMRRINSTSGQQKHPVVVHCSAGIGRTGTYIAVDSLVSQAKTEGTVDVVSFVSNMRSQRKNMIQTKEQYLFVYQAVMSAVVMGDTSLDVDVIKQINLGHVTDVTMGSRTVQQHVKELSSYPETSASNNITRVPSYASRLGFFVFKTQPGKEKLWHQIYNSNSRTLVTWGHANESYLPSPGGSVSTSSFTVSMRSSKVLSDNTILSTLYQQKKDDKEGLIIHHYHVTGSTRDPSVSVLIDSLLQWTGQPDSESTTIVSQSVSETRLLILLVNITSRLQDDGKVDVIGNMRRLQSLLGGPRFTEDDVRLCVEFCQRRLESLQV